ncbi:response regulator [Sulfurimonas sp. C5]|uniref:response regulator transcription factor n=1 Tax=Sulfurimonas sp. C5 TaxID=3036947 RepID=UPI0024583BFA|nr:response regulator [Sulfurimonas sp. C5]MDH4944347.1 response regulator [Sulfurimonas sp. C5]
MKKELQAIHKLSGDISLLYVEDNAGLRQNMETLLGRVFQNIFIAEDGEEGYGKFLEHKPKLLITDLHMQQMSGFKLIKKISAIDPNCKVIILSAYDEKEHLHLAIKLGVFRYLEKPVKTPELLNAVYFALKAIHEVENRCLFTSQLSTILNYQNNIVVMMHESEFILCNERFYEFFGVDNMEEFKEKYDDINTLLHEHKEFLYSTPEEKWYEIVAQNPGKLFHTKIKNHDNEFRHLILKAREVPEKEGYFVLSFDDVTELNLMYIFDSDTAKQDMLEQDTETIISLMRIVQNNSSELKIHNFYRGLTIVNPAVIVSISDDEVVLKMPYPQLKVIHLTKYMTIFSEIFPKNVLCRSIKKVDLDTQSVIINKMSFATNNITDREFIRLEPEESHKCTFFYKDIKYEGPTSIIDISEVSIKISIQALPAGLAVDTEVKISFNLTINNQIISIVTDATVFRIDENPKNFYLVLMYELPDQNLHKLRDYLAHRQMALIREFKNKGADF